MAQEQDYQEALARLTLQIQQLLADVQHGIFPGWQSYDEWVRNGRALPRSTYRVRYRVYGDSFGSVQMKTEAVQAFNEEDAMRIVHLMNRECGDRPMEIISVKTDDEDGADTSS